MRTISSLATTTRICRAARGPVVLVATMGALHHGHGTLIRRARRLAGKEGLVVVSIFVNPTQFGPQEDFARYPRPFLADRKLCEQAGADLLFHPSAEAMYPEGHSTTVDESALSLTLCGAARPGHFRGVCTVVLKLFLITQPQMAVFGLKDFQQCAVIRQMVRDLNVPVRIVSVPTAREPDGLAISSRNRFLQPEERAQSVILHQALLEARAAFDQGEVSAANLQKVLVRAISTAPLARIDYASIADATTLRPVATVGPNTVIALAVFFGKTRLIDNLQIL